MREEKREEEGGKKKDRGEGWLERAEKTPQGE
jgi:hypothetical protein